jgi:hypothetical protein
MKPPPLLPCVLLALLLRPGPDADAEPSPADACRQAQEGEMAEGTYAGRWESEWLASGGALDLRLTLSFGGELRVTVDQDGALEASGTISFTMTGNADGLPAFLRAGLGVDGRGTLEPAAKGRERFGASGTVTVGATVFATGPTVEGEVQGGGAERGTFDFTVTERSCRSAAGTFASGLLDRLTAGLSAQGLTLWATVPPHWSIRSTDTRAEEEAERYREQAERIRSSPHKAAEQAFETLFAELRGLPAGRRACLERAVREVYFTRVEQWLREDLEALGTLEVSGDDESLQALIALVAEILGHDLALECSGRATGGRAQRLRPAFDAIVRGIRGALRHYNLRDAKAMLSLLALFSVDSAVTPGDGDSGDQAAVEALSTWAELAAEAAAEALEQLREVTASDANVDPDVVRTYEDWARATERERREANDDYGENRVDQYCATTDKC